MKTYQIIGATATIKWLDTDETVEGVYFSFGEYYEEVGRDSFGVLDDRVFFYATGEQEMKQLMEPYPYNDFIVVDYQLERETK